MARSILKRHKAFIAAFKTAASITEAAKAIGVDRAAHYDWLRDVAGYKEAFEAAKEEAAQTLEDEAVRRAMKGTTEAIYYQGKAVGARRVYSDALMMFLLRGMRPEKYRQGFEISGPNGGALETALTVTFVKAKTEDQ
jgi:hypothetical protein